MTEPKTDGSPAKPVANAPALNHPVDAFVRLLEQSNLLTAEQLDDLRASISSASGKVDPRAIARKLCQQKLITTWQAQQLLAGRSMFFLGKYKLLEKLGAGGMGAVYKAEQTNWGRLVALKVMSADLVSNPVSVSRFHREIQAAAALRHPNIIAAYDADHVGKTHFFVMEYVVGRDLDDFIEKEGTMAIPVACECVRQAAVGLQHAHEKGMVHRDIKPANLLLTQQGDGPKVVKILDMGLARFSAEAEDGKLTKTGVVVGTPDYMSPEQAQNSKTADIRADIFSLGCTLFHLLAGKVPFGGDNVMEKLMARALKDAPLIRQFRPEIPPRLEQIIAKAIARSRDDRYATPGEFAKALEPFANAETKSDFIDPGDSGSLAATVELAESPLAGLNLAHETSKSLADVEAKSDAEMNEFLSALDNSAHQSSATRMSIERIIPAPIAEDSPAHAARFWKMAFIIGAVVAVGLAVAVERLGQTVLILNWPEDVPRKNAELRIDGKFVTIRDEGPIEYRGLWGARQIRVTAPDMRDYEEIIPMSYGATKSIDLKLRSSVPPLAAAPFSAERAAALQAKWAKHLDTPMTETNTIGMTFMLIPPGEFVMGSSAAEMDEQKEEVVGREEEERLKSAITTQAPAHRVKITKAFYMSAYEVTVGQFRQFVEATGHITTAEAFYQNRRKDDPDPKEGKEGKYTWGAPKNASSDKNAVVFISYADAVAFAKWLSAKEGKFYQLPTEAQWEYAARAGSETKWSFGNDEADLGVYAWTERNALQKIHPVGEKMHNPFGLFDMHGNAIEWCFDQYDATFYAHSPSDDPVLKPTSTTGTMSYVRRGGSFRTGPLEQRSAWREPPAINPPMRTYEVYGFRLVRSVR